MLEIKGHQTVGPVIKTERPAGAPKIQGNSLNKGTLAQKDRTHSLACHLVQIDVKLLIPSVPLFNEFPWIFGAPTELSV